MDHSGGGSPESCARAHGRDSADTSDSADISRACYMGSALSGVFLAAPLGSTCVDGATRSVGVGAIRWLSDFTTEFVNYLVANFACKGGSCQYHENSGCDRPYPKA